MRALRGSWAVMPLCLAISAAVQAADQAEESVVLGAISVSDDLNSTAAPLEVQAQGGAMPPVPLRDLPMQVDSVTRATFERQQARTTADVLRNETSVAEAYAPAGYFESFSVRGFTLDGANSYRINGMSAVGEQIFALDNKERVDVLKGLDAANAGLNSPGGTMNYITKRPAKVRSVSLSVDQHGSQLTAVDVGDWLDDEQRFGVRVNAAYEKLDSYVDHLGGHRRFASIATDWQISDRTQLQFDAEYQVRQQRTAPGYQLLGGTRLPHGVNPDKLVGYQPWSEPLHQRAYNLNALLTHEFDEQWTGRLAVSRSDSKVDNNSAFPYGYCPGYDAQGNCPGWMPSFGPNGEYDLYNFLSPHERTRHDEWQASMAGDLQFFGLRDELVVGAGVLRRTRSYNRSMPFALAGEDNIYNPVWLPEPDMDKAYKAYADSDGRQRSVFLNNSLHLNEQWQWQVGGQQVWYKERYLNDSVVVNQHLRREKFLPQTALLFQPNLADTYYISYSEGLTPGTSSAISDNAGEILPPSESEQLELGWRHEGERATYTAAVFEMRQDLQLNRPDGQGNFIYMQKGKKVNRGVEVSAKNQITDNLKLLTNASYIRSRWEKTGDKSYEGHQGQNVPSWRAAMQADYQVPMVSGLGLTAGARYSSSKYADRTGNVKVAGYTVLNAGANYRMKLAGYDSTFFFNIDNLTNRRYWRDVGDYLGDDYLFPGAPRTARLTAQFDF